MPLPRLRFVTLSPDETGCGFDRQVLLPEAIVVNDRAREDLWKPGEAACIPEIDISYD